MRSNKWLAALVIVVLAACAPPINDVKMQKPIFLHTDRTERVYVDVRNVSSCQNFPLEAEIKERLRAKGYTVVEHAKDAKLELRVLIRYCGLAEDAFTGAGTAAGAAGGFITGGTAAYAGGGDDQNAAAGALVGMAVGAIVGSIVEEEARKTTFVGIIDVEITEKNEPFPHLTTIYTTVRQHKLTADEAIAKVRENLVTQISNIF